MGAWAAKASKPQFGALQDFDGGQKNLYRIGQITALKVGNLWHKKTRKELVLYGFRNDPYVRGFMTCVEGLEPRGFQIGAFGHTAKAFPFSFALSLYNPKIL